ncbi:MAG: DUF4870 domain-containing protein [Micrococcaceae bacterium]
MTMTKVPHPNQFRPKEDKDWATLAHLGGVVGPIAPFMINHYLGGYGKFTKRESRESLEFTFPLFVIIIMFFLLGQIPVHPLHAIFRGIGVALWLFMGYFAIRAGMQTNLGRPFSYPFNLMKYWRIVTEKEKPTAYPKRNIQEEKRQKQIRRERRAKNKAIRKAKKESAKVAKNNGIRKTNKQTQNMTMKPKQKIRKQAVAATASSTATPKAALKARRNKTGVNVSGNSTANIQKKQQ